MPRSNANAFSASQIARFLIRHPGLWSALAAGLALKGILLATGSVTFNADEAVLSLMARHILQGQHSAFFYGQAYMGSLDAYLRSLMFLILGQTVIAGRLLQIALFAAVVATTYVLALRLSSNAFGALSAALLTAVPPVLFSLYTSAGIGDYVEVLLFNNLLWLLGWDLIEGRKQSPGWWMLAGAIAGVGWWSMSLIAVSAAPLVVIGAWHLRGSLPWRGIAFAAAGFVLGSAPWWIAILGDPAVLPDLMGSRVAEIPTNGLGVIGQRLVSLFLFNLTALVGLRPPWSMSWIALPVGLLIAALYAVVMWRSVREAFRSDGSDAQRLRHRSLLGAWLLVTLAMIFTRFGNDPTGRYLLHLYPPLAILVGDWMARARYGLVIGSRRVIGAAPAVLVVVVGYNLWGNARCIIQNPPGLTTQFDLISHIPHDQDDELIAFLDSVGADRGYSNYWVAFRLAFLTRERIILSSRLPYKADMSYTPLDERYQPYAEAVEAADEVVYITSNHPELDAVLRQQFEAHGVSFREAHIGTDGPYTVFYDLSRRVSPDELDLPWLSEDTR